jgi:uncharacterized membrane protein YedE/YeeE
LIGGFLMGIGMVIAAGCPFRLITRASEGDLTAVFAILGFVLGIVLFAQVLPSIRDFFIHYSFSEATFIQDLFGYFSGR